jgi:hypothetical protein
MIGLNNLKKSNMTIIKTSTTDLTYYEVIQDGYSKLYFNIVDLLKDFKIPILTNFNLN